MDLVEEGVVVREGAVANGEHLPTDFCYLRPSIELLCVCVCVCVYFIEI